MVVSLIEITRIIFLLSILYIPRSDGQAADNAGTEFIVVFMKNQVETPLNLPLELFVTTARTIPVQVEITAPLFKDNIIKKQLTVVAGQVERVEITHELRLDSVDIYNRVVRVVAEEEIVVYALNKEHASTDGFLVFPIDTIGYEHYTISYVPTTLHTQFAVAAKYENTEVTIRLPAEARNKKRVRVQYGGNTYYSGHSFNITLKAYQTFQCISLDEADLSTSYIKSTKPVAVFSGNTRTWVGEASSRDHMAIQVPPLQAFGKVFPVIPTPNRTNGDYIKIITSGPPTTITVTSSETPVYYEIGTDASTVQFRIPSNQFTLITANEPVLVAQITQSQSENEPGDPTMLSVTAVSQFISDYTFATPTNSDGSSYKNWLMVVVQSEDKDGLILDGRAFRYFNPTWKSFSGSSLEGCQIEISEGAHRLRHSSPVATLSGYLYGTGDRESYSLQIGSRMALINQPCVESDSLFGDGVDNDCDGFIDEEICTGISAGNDTDGDGLIDEDCALTREPAAGAPDAGGRQFLIVFMENSLQQFMPLELYVTPVRAKVAAVQVDSPKWFEPYIHQTAQVSLGRVQKFLIPYTMKLSGTSISSKVLFVTSDADILLFGVNKEQYSSDAFLALPVDVMGKEYYTVTYYPNSDRSLSQFAVIGLNDGTRLDITLPNPFHPLIVELDGVTYRNGEKIVQPIGRYSALQIQAAGDLSGTHIKSSQAISVYSGNIRTSVGAGNTRDHLVVMLPAVQSWGKRFYIVTIPERSAGDVIKIVASVSRTQITVTDQINFTLNAGQSRLITINSGDYTEITADHPIMVVQLSQSQSLTSELGDPTMILIPSIEQWSNYYTFSTVTGVYNNADFTNFILIVAPSNKVNGIIFGGQIIPDLFTTWYPIHRSGYSGTSFPISDGVHSIQHIDPTITISVIVYANADKESYGFAAGMRLADINAPCETSYPEPGDGIDNDCDGRIDEEICEGDAKLIDNVDDDGDSRFNEDCALYIPPATPAPPTVSTTPISTLPTTTTTPIVIVGPPGAAGPAGLEGLPGPQGLPGKDGYPGIDGRDGVDGFDGAKGEKGSQGRQGAVGQAGTKGSTGEIGLGGATGGDGNQGQKGETGQKGVKGSIGATIKGSKGDEGVTGVGGSTGAQGNTGIIGATGIIGSDGQTGVSGPSGADGFVGEKGDRGVPYIDVNECQTGVHTCSHECSNTIGSYLCLCPHSLTLSDDDHTCIDVNECLISNGGCDNECTNLIGSYSCSCLHRGFLLADNKHTCIDHDECSEDACGGELICTNSVGSYSCINTTIFIENLVLPGKQCDLYEILQDGTCQSVRSCERYNGECHDVCTPIQDGVICSCSDPGFVLSSDGVTCQDVNECVNVEDICGSSAQCLNSWGSFICLNQTRNTDSSTPAAVGSPTAGFINGTLLFALLIWLLLLSILLIGLLIFFTYQTRLHSTVKRHYRCDMSDLRDIIQERSNLTHIKDLHDNTDDISTVYSEDYKTHRSISAPASQIY